MKAKFTRVLILLIIILFALPERTEAQFFGRVMINEYMPWPGNACGTTSEFVELFNMGPGPVNIGCFVLTDGDFALTIPPGTVMYPGDYYVIAGQSLLIAPCANFTKNVVPDLNWNTCNCTNAPIPPFGDGWFTDGGFASEQVVLLNPMGQEVDAIYRQAPGEPSSVITTRAVPGCSPFTFDLDLIPLNYETIGESAGRGNSIARKLDGGCGWVKDTQQTGSETNNTPGARYEFTLSMFITEDLYCTGGTARFVVDQALPADWFPVDYILAYDVDNDGQFTFADDYVTGIDYTAPDIEIPNLPYGYYAISLGPKQGCSYQNFTFAIGPCTTLGYKLHSFSADKFTKDILFSGSVSGADELADIFLEGSYNGKDFFKIDNVGFSATTNMQNINYILGSTPYSYFRLMLVDKDHKASYSAIKKISMVNSAVKVKLAGNPVGDQIRLATSTTRREMVEIQLINSAGQVMQQQKYNISAGTNILEIPIQRLSAGMYFLKTQVGEGYVETFRVIKQ
jgi:hypothetical protein